MCSYISRFVSFHKSYTGQAVVEGAFLIPVFLLLLMLLIQPGILLYNYMVMSGAAAEGCRLLATRSDALGEHDAYEESIRRHLGSIPQQDQFHIHQTQCSWTITLEGAAETDQVSVRIEHQIKPLPLFDFVFQVVGLTNDAGNFVQVVELRRTTYSDWVKENEDGLNPDAWVHRDASLLRGEGS